MLWNIEFYESTSGKTPVAEFFDSLEVKSQARIARTLVLLEDLALIWACLIPDFLKSNSGN